jgi:hypothetical protein
MGRWVKLVIGLLLLPVCFGAAATLWRILHMQGRADPVWIPMAVGAAAWGLLYIVFPRPMWLYVLGHELTHAVWTWCFGGRVRDIQVSSEGGSVTTSKTNFLIALAPYFFPFYVVLIVAVFALARLVLTWDQLEVCFLGGVGVTYAFHLTLTGHILKTRQSDITEHGYLFSAAVIFLGNIGVLLLGIPLLTSTPTIPTAFAWCWESTRQVIQTLHGWIV